jgi:hypothetical protein
MQNLRNTLTYNAVFSSFSGLSMLLFSNPLAEWMHITEPLALPMLGIALLLFGGFLLWIALRKAFSEPLVNFIIVLDICWVVGSLLLVLTQVFGLSSLGLSLVGIVAAIVGLFAYLQIKYLKQIRLQ